MKGLVFVVEGDAHTSLLAKQCLEETGYTVRTFSTEDAIEEAQKQRPTLMLIAATLPDKSGAELCKRVRQHPLLARTPIVLLVSSARDEDLIGGLASGADDCIAKPFPPRELVARVQAVLRSIARAQPDPLAEAADITIDKAAMKLVVRGIEVAITTLEFRLIDYLARHRGQVFTRDVLLDAVWGELQFVSPRSVDTCIRRVREKIEPVKDRTTYLKTVRGVGYRFDAAVHWPKSAEECDCPACNAPSKQSAIACTVSSKRRRSVVQSTGGTPASQPRP